MNGAVDTDRSIAIVGGGIIGLSIAWELAKSGHPITVYEKGDVAKEASWAGAGMLAPGGEIDRNTPLAAAALQGRTLYPDFVAALSSESGISIDLQLNGALELAYSDDEVARLEERRAVQADIGIQSKRMEPRQVTTFWPRVRQESLRMGFFYPGDGIVDPRDVTSALLVACRKRGVRIVEQALVARIETRATRARIFFSDGSEARHRFVVIAAGAWSNSINVSPLPALPLVEPVKGILLGYQQPSQTCSTIVRRGHTYLLQRENGLLIVGASAQKSGFDRTIAPEVIEQLSQSASELFPHLGETTPTSVWTGFRPHAESPHVGFWHSRTLLLAYGHYRNGILLAPATAKQIAAEINAS